MPLGLVVRPALPTERESYNRAWDEDLDLRNSDASIVMFYFLIVVSRHVLATETSPINKSSRRGSQSTQTNQTLMSRNADPMPARPWYPGMKKECREVKKVSALMKKTVQRGVRKHHHRNTNIVLLNKKSRNRGGEMKGGGPGYSEMPPPGRLPQSPPTQTHSPMLGLAPSLAFCTSSTRPLKTFW